MATAKDIMTDEVATIKGSATVAEAVQLMKFKKLHSLIVERRGPEDAYGIVTDTDIVNKVVAYGSDPKTIKVYEIMNKPCLVINPDLGVEYVARLFAQFGIDRAPVIQNGLVGIISNTDILQKSDFVENPRVPLLKKALQAQVAHARGVSAAIGPYSKGGQEAWAAVAELEAELAFCQGQAPAQSVVEDAPEPEPALV
ncbi:MAG: CBS domain-containing protein [Leptolyngbya sp. LCM1.Bin17]|nr:MAG: CBS domain-containing protein [Leptolyngbya sp. LCM1.Bin17]